MNVMGQYRPEYRANEFEEINRCPTSKEMTEAHEMFTEAGLRRMDKRSPVEPFLLGLFDE